MMADASKSVLIVGCGDIGGRVAALEQAEGASVAALARSEAAALRLAPLGVRPLPGDLDRPATLRGLPAAATVYYFAPPPAEGTGDPRIRALLAALDPASLPARLVYISTSGVYGDCGGAWVDEERPPNPQTGRARRRLDAETAVRAFGERTGVAWALLRVPGIYGPGRLPVERLRKGLPILCAAESPFSNRIHADDLAAVCVAAARRAPAGAVYNAADGHPTTMSDYFNRAADLLGLPRPPAVSLAEARQALTPAMLSFLEESKRLDNRRMLRELGIRLRYPTLEAGLAACGAAAAPCPG
jgi:nucleoside-diphosphate-sugar epimerase